MSEIIDSSSPLPTEEHRTFLPDREPLAPEPAPAAQTEHPPVPFGILIQNELDRLNEIACKSFTPKQMHRIDNKAFVQMTEEFARALEMMGPLDKSKAMNITGHDDSIEFEVFVRVFGLRSHEKEGTLYYSPRSLANGIARARLFELRNEM